MSAWKYAAFACLLASPAAAADAKIVDIKASLFFEHAGRFSENIVGEPLDPNLAKGGAPGHESATAVLLDFIFTGEKNSAPKYATATVDITQSSKTGQQTVTHKAFANFLFGPDGVQHKAILVENATCSPLEVQVHSGKTEKGIRLDFRCD